MAELRKLADRVRCSLERGIEGGQASVWAMQRSHSKEALTEAIEVAELVSELLGLLGLLGLLSSLLWLSNKPSKKTTTTASL